MSINREKRERACAFHANAFLYALSHPETIQWCIIRADLLREIREKHLTTQRKRWKGIIPAHLVLAPYRIMDTGELCEIVRGTSQALEHKVERVDAFVELSHRMGMWSPTVHIFWWYFEMGDMPPTWDP